LTGAVESLPATGGITLLGHRGSDRRDDHPFPTLGGRILRRLAVQSSRRSQPPRGPQPDRRGCRARGGASAPEEHAATSRVGAEPGANRRRERATPESRRQACHCAMRRKGRMRPAQRLKDAAARDIAPKYARFTDPLAPLTSVKRRRGSIRPVASSTITEASERSYPRGPSESRWDRRWAVGRGRWRSVAPAAL